MENNKPNFSPIKILNFYLFNSSWGPREGEEEKKIVYFWPKEYDLDSKLKKIGLVEGVVTFSNKFSSSPAHSLHTLKERTVFFEAEPNYWLCLSIAVPNVRRQAKDSGEIIEFYPEDADDDVLLAICRKSYRMFCLFHSSLTSALERCEGNRPLFSDLVNHFFSRYLSTLNVEKEDVTTVWGGIQYLALNAKDFLTVQSLINRMELQFDNISKSLFLQSGQLVWSGVEPGVTKLLVQYLSTTILPLIPSLPRQLDGAFPVGEDKLPVIYIGEKSFYLSVFHAINTTICLLLHATPKKSFFNDFKETLGREVGNLSADLTHDYISKPGSAAPLDGVSFLYFNAANLALKSVVEDGQDRLIKVGADFLTDLGRQGDKYGEVMVKMSTDEWVVVQLAGPRIILQLFQDKNLNLIEVADAVSRLEKTSFDSICML